MVYEDPIVLIAYWYAVGMALAVGWCITAAAIKAYTRRNR